jgi:signal transduction histidine kinase
MLANDALSLRLTEPLRRGFPLILPVAAALAYYAGAKVAFHVGTLSHLFAPLWPPNVVLLIALLATPRRRWWTFVAAALPVHLLAEMEAGMPALQALAAFVSNCVFALLSAAGLCRLIGGPRWLGDLRRVIAYLAVAAIIGPGIAAFGAAAEPILIGAEAGDYWGYWWRWYLSNAVGAVTLAPALLTWFADGIPRAKGVRPSAQLEAILLTGGLGIACVVAFGVPFRSAAAGLVPVLLFAPVPLLLWAAVRFGTKGASGAVLAVTAVSILYAMQGYGPFADGAPNENVLALQLFLVVIATPVLLLAALVEELRGANDRLTGILASISDCYYAVDGDGKVAAINPRAMAWLGGDPGEAMVGRDAEEVLYAPEAISPHVRRSIELMTPLNIEVPSTLYPGRWVELRTHPTDAGTSVFFCDITKRKSAELAKRDTQELLQSTLDALSAQVTILDRRGVIVAVNAAWRRFAWRSGFRAANAGIGGNYLAVCDASSPSCPEAAELATGLRAVIAGSTAALRLEYPGHRHGDPPRWFELRVTRFGEGEELRLVLAHEDITETWRAADATRKLVGALLQAQDVERRRIARELHDSTAQNLLGVTLDLRRVRKLAPKLSGEAAGLLAEIEALIEQSQREIRTFSYLLHPPRLEDAGLTAALRDYAEGFSSRTGIKVDVAIASDVGRMPREVELALYRVAQEALANTHRHSGSQAARLRLAHERVETPEPHLVLVVEDDGAGGAAPPAARAYAASKPRAAEPAGVGIASMRERMRQLGGRLEIASGDDGTTLRAVVPLRRRQGTAHMGP